MALKTDLVGVWCEGAAPGEDLHTNSLTLTNNNSTPTTAGKIGTAGNFEDADSNYLSRADEDLLSTGDISWTQAAWVQIESYTQSYLMSKGTGVSDAIERVMLFRTFGGENRFRVYIADFAVGVAATTFGLPDINTWYYLQAQHDADNDLLRIRVNNGAWDSVGTGGVAPTDSTAPFFIGAYNDNGTPILFWDGLVNQFAFWKGIKSDADLNAIYNAGNGLAFSKWEAGLVLADLLKTLKTSFGIGKATFDAAGLTAPRTFTLPDASGTVKLQNKAEEAAARLCASRLL